MVYAIHDATATVDSARIFPSRRPVHFHKFRHCPYEGGKKSLETGDLRPLVAATPMGKVVTAAMSLNETAKKDGARGVIQKFIPLNEVKPAIQAAKQAWAAGDHYGAARQATKAAQAVGDTVMMAYGGATALPSVGARAANLADRLAKNLRNMPPPPAVAATPNGLSVPAAASESGAAKPAVAMSTGGGGKGTGGPPPGAPAQPTRSPTAPTSTSAEARAKEIHGAVGEATQRRTTIAVTETSAGVRVVSSSEKRLRPAQRAMLKPGEIEAVGIGHAEVTGVQAAKAKGLGPTQTAASRPICDPCAGHLKQEGVQPASPLKSRCAQ